MTARTSNTQEMNPETEKIGSTMQKCFASGVQAHMFGRKNQVQPSRFTPLYFLGKDVDDFENIQPGFETLTLSAGKYVKFTSTPGKMPVVCMSMWQNIWKTNVVD